MSTAVKRHTERVCPDCGAKFLRHSGKATGRCLDCAGKVFAQVARESYEKAGPTYEKVVRGQLRYWHGEARRLQLHDVC